MKRLLEGTMAVLVLQLASGCVVVSYSYTESFSTQTLAHLNDATEPAGVTATSSDSFIYPTPCSLNVKPANDPVLPIERSLASEAVRAAKSMAARWLSFSLVQSNIASKTVRSFLRLRLKYRGIRAALTSNVNFEDTLSSSNDDNDCQQYSSLWCCACLSFGSILDGPPEQRGSIYSPVVARLIEIDDEGNIESRQENHRPGDLQLHSSSLGLEGSFLHSLRGDCCPAIQGCWDS